MRSRGGVVGLVLLLLVAALCLRPSGPEPAPAAAPIVAAPATPPPAASALAAAPAPAAPAPAAPVAPATSIVVLRWRSDRIELAGQVVKPSLLPAGATEATAVRWRLADAATGRLLAEGPVAAPRLCDCDRGADHRAGCRRLRHEAVVRLKVPHLAPRERLLIHDGDRELAALDLEGTS